MVNPPYGERIRVDDIEALYNMIGERLKHVFSGYDAYVLSFKKENFDNIGLKPAKRFFLFNGALECEMRKYEIFAGKRDDRLKEERSTRRYDRDNRPTGNNKREFKRNDFGDRRGDRPRGGGDRDRSRDGGGARDRGEFKERDRGASVDKPRRFDRESKSRTDHRPYDRTKVVFDDETNRPVFKKKEPYEYPKRNDHEKGRGAEKKVNKVFIARKRPTKKGLDDDAKKETNNDKE